MTSELRAVLEAAGVSHELRAHEATYHSAEDRATAFGVDLAQMAPTLVLRTERGPMVATVSGATRLSLRKWWLRGPGAHAEAAPGGPGRSDRRPRLRHRGRKAGLTGLPACAGWYPKVMMCGALRRVAAEDAAEAVVFGSTTMALTEAMREAAGGLPLFMPGLVALGVLELLRESGLWPAREPMRA